MPSPAAAGQDWDQCPACASGIWGGGQGSGGPCDALNTSEAWSLQALPGATPLLSWPAEGTSPIHGAEVPLGSWGRPWAPTAGRSQPGAVSSPSAGSSHLLCPLRLRVVVQEGPFQHGGHDGEPFASLELRCEGQELRVHHVLLLIPADQDQQLRPGRTVLQSVPAPRPAPPPLPPPRFPRSPAWPHLQFLVCGGPSSSRSRA